MKTALRRISENQNPQMFYSKLSSLAIAGVLVSFALGLSSCSSMSPEEKANQILVENILKLGCESWKKNPIDTREVSSNFAKAANTYNEQHTDKKYDPLAMAAINWSFIDITNETPGDERMIKTLAGFTIIEFCKSGKVIDYANS
jgi:hypothetical protein